MRQSIKVICIKWIKEPTLWLIIENKKWWSIYDGQTLCMMTFQFLIVRKFPSGFSQENHLIETDGSGLKESRLKIFVIFRHGNRNFQISFVAIYRVRYRKIWIAQYYWASTTTIIVLLIMLEPLKWLSRVQIWKINIHWPIIYTGRIIW